MLIKLGLGPKPLAALQTGVGLGARVQPHVRRERALLQELAAAYGARVRHAAVQLAVIGQLEFARECGATVAAHERVQGAVEARVHRQVVLLGERFAAVAAHVGASASRNVRLNVRNVKKVKNGGKTE